MTTDVTSDLGELTTTAEPATDTNGHADAAPAEPTAGAKRVRKPRAAADTEPAPATASAGVVEQLRAARDLALSRRRQLIAELDDLDNELGAIGVTLPGKVEFNQGSLPVTVTAPIVRAPRPSRKPAAKRHRRTNADIVKGAADVAAYVKKHGGKDGVGAEAIRKALKIERKHWGMLIRKALADKAVKAKGEKRGTVYHFAG